MISLEKECKRDLVGDFVQEGLCSCCKIHRGGGGEIMSNPSGGLCPHCKKHGYGGLGPSILYKNEQVFFVQWGGVLSVYPCN